MWALLATTCLLAASAAADDSLRSALHAVQKRQRDLSPQEPLYFNRPNMMYSEGQPEDIGYGYQKTVPGTPGLFEALPIPASALGASYDTSKPIAGFFLDDKYNIPSSKRSIFRERGDSADALQRIYEENQQDDDGPLLIPSPFRERMSEKSRLQNAHALVRNFGGLNRQPEDQLGDDDYINVLNNIWEKYKNEEDPEDITEADVEDILEYLARKEEKKRQQYGNYDTGYDFFNAPMSWTKREPRMEAHHKRYHETLFDERYPYRGPQKRYPITKRSPTVVASTSVSHRHKKNTPEKQQTDPKVAAELNNIFSSPQKTGKNHTETTTTTQVPNTTQTPGQKEQTGDNSSLKPLEVKKKSINWSDYFGIDRRKKSADSEINNEWLARKYLEKYGYFDKDKDQMSMENQKKRPDDVDNKMRAMEDLIVDQAIKYTGAHEGTTDSKEIQEVKDKVMAQLAAAYSLEKMRRALGEFKASIAAQRANNPSGNGVVMPKQDQELKPKLMKDKPEAASAKMEKKDIPEIRNEVAEIGNLHGRECPVLQGVEMRCKEVASMSGDRAQVFLPLCNLHHMCYLCGAVLRAASPRECDTAFLEEAESVCREDPSCYYMARRTLSVARSLKPDPNLVCDWRNSPCLAQFLSLTTEK
ncbi:unnamed protein product [Nezara viridula]|uniref:Neuropeptide n=1 Tax=Nezara viridula TaxID=85310 RepID=A0A9P0MX45_NEZVI|nr:unnamed protein product [Nezara viridula]